MKEYLFSPSELDYKLKDLVLSFRKKAGQVLPDNLLENSKKDKKN